MNIAIKETVWCFLKQLKIVLPDDPAILLWDIYLKERKSARPRGLCTSLFIAALFLIITIWKQPKCPSMNE